MLSGTGLSRFPPDKRSGCVAFWQALMAALKVTTWDVGFRVLGSGFRVYGTVGPARTPLRSISKPVNVCIRICHFKLAYPHTYVAERER